MPVEESSLDPQQHPKCSDCGEPVELTDSADLESWIHAVEANYWGDHTAWVESPAMSSEIQQKSSS